MTGCIRDYLVETLFFREDVRKEDIDSKVVAGYLQTIGTVPHSAHMYREDQLKAHSPNEPLYLDPTGSICRKIGQDKRIMYYALIDSGPANEAPIPVAELITNNHRSLNISHFLNSVISDYRKATNKDLKPWKLEADFIWCWLHAGCFSFNQISISQYLDECLKHVLEPSNKFRHTKILHLRSAHMIHLVARKIKSVSDKNLRHFILYVFARMPNVSELREIEQIFYDFAVVLFSPTSNDCWRRSLDNLNSHIKGLKSNTDSIEVHSFQ